MIQPYRNFLGVVRASAKQSRDCIADERKWLPPSPTLKLPPEQFGSQSPVGLNLEYGFSNWEHHKWLEVLNKALQ
jgi:hypothetical protein